MFLEYFDIKRTDWSPAALATVLNRLQESGYQSLTLDVHAALDRYLQGRSDGALDASENGKLFTEILIPPAQPHTRIVMHSVASDLARVVIFGRSQHEVHTSATAVKMHLEHALGAKLKDQITDENGRADIVRFRREVLPALGLVGEGGPSPPPRHPDSVALLRALRQQPAFRGKPTILAGHVSVLAPDRPVEQIRDTLDQLAADGVVERWYVVLCKEGRYWLAVSPSVQEIKAFIASNVACPHCGNRVSDERSETAYRLGEDGQMHASEDRWMSGLVETTLRKLGVEAVAVQPGGKTLDGAASYLGSVLIFRAREAVPSVAEAQSFREDARKVESQGWRVHAILFSNQPVPEQVKAAGITVVEGVSALERTLVEVLEAAREASLQTLLPPVLHPVSVALSDLVPAEQRQAVTAN